MDSLPEHCVSAILALTSPEDACRLALASSTFPSAARSDVVWGGFFLKKARCCRGGRSSVQEGALPQLVPTSAH
ncbi:hypothetical protein NL676_030866 [Syzygium grande]|nr:hypothetical protein NL676_030866 [Syzygium grande]